MFNCFINIGGQTAQDENVQCKKLIYGPSKTYKKSIEANYFNGMKFKPTQEFSNILHTVPLPNLPMSRAYVNSLCLFGKKFSLGSQVL